MTDYAKNDMSSGNNQAYPESRDRDRNPTMGRPQRDSFRRRTCCRICTGKTSANYKDFEALRRFTTGRGKILPRRITGTCAKHQRLVTREIKRARILALLPFASN